jgi:hypothetical protein
MLDEDGFDIGDDLEPEPELTKLMSREQFLKYAELEHDIKSDLLWTYQALGAESLRPEDAPSPGAWFLYAATRDNDLSKKAFITGPVTKLLPSKAQMEIDDRADDGRKIFNLIDDLLREPSEPASVLSSTERRARQLAVSPKSN